MTDHFIVVDDPTGEFWSGSLVDSNRNRILEARGVATLPVLPQLAKLSGVGGYAKREWGAGFPLDFAIPKMCCPLTMFCTRDYHNVTWVARLSREPETPPRTVFDGTIRMSADSGQASPFNIGLTTDEKPHAMRELGKSDNKNGWTIKGRARIQVPQDGHYGFALYGAAPGLRVVWAAVSLS